MLKVFYAGVNGPTADAVLHMLSEYRLRRLEKTAQPEAKAQSFAAELLLIRAVQAVYPNAELPLKITVGEFGKPELRDIDLKFSLSHSADMVLCAISDKCVGADIQLRTEYNAALAERFFTKKEAAVIVHSADKDLMFTRTWAVKESYLKLLGTGMHRSLSSFDMICDNGRFLIDRAPECSVSVAERGDYTLAVSALASGTPELVEVRL
jgi:4'-phosphopantetheinyl transferase